MDKWCTDNCAIGNCPVYGCDCSNGTQLVTKASTTQQPSTTTTTTTRTTTTTSAPPPPPTTTTTTTQTSTSTTTRPTTTTTLPSTTLSTPQLPPGGMGKQLECKAINLWEGNSYLDRLCADTCSKGNCPSMSCKCTFVNKVVTQSTTTVTAPTTLPKLGTKVCLALSIWKGIKVFDNWCTEECNKGNCPLDTCQCTEVTALPASTSFPPTTTTSDTTPLGRCTSNEIVGGDYWNEWCQKKCDKGECDIGYCFCNI
ncbi:salivary glue protein Sgs-3-like [Ruditapes philippinarum]|uniref:salivary glue protein Sgs-3-like n=1 Tax=Ruditapes philippinarum TaxID=129788 RepID=UPI00295B673C|nr:salivary glue protein Sgs-3-like [Ruditapes philippinarum]